MIQQRPGDLLEIDLGGRYFYVVVLTKIVQFGGNIVFAFHGDGSRRQASSLHVKSPGFNICTDLIGPKRTGSVSRLDRFEDFSGFWRTRYVKKTNQGLGIPVRTPFWWVGSIDDLQSEWERFGRLPTKYYSAMDSATYSFDLVAEKILASYTPEQNQYLTQ